MGCGGSSAAKPDPPPNGAPEDWKAKPTATFKLLDKTESSWIVLVAYKVRETKFSEISALGDDIMEQQKAIGDFETTEKVFLTDWIDLIKARIEDKGWEPVSNFLDAIDAAVADTKRNTCETLAKGIFKTMDEGWAEPANTKELDFASECEALADKTHIKAAALIEGLEKEKKMKVDEWVAHCKGKVEVLGWPRAQMCLKVLEARLEKVADAGDVVAGMG